MHGEKLVNKKMEWLCILYAEKSIMCGLINHELVCVYHLHMSFYADFHSTLWLIWTGIYWHIFFLLFRVHVSEIQSVVPGNRTIKRLLFTLFFSLLFSPVVSTNAWGELNVGQRKEGEGVEKMIPRFQLLWHSNIRCRTKCSVILMGILVVFGFFFIHHQICTHSHEMPQH